MFRVETDKPKKLLTIVFTQHVGAGDAKACADKVREVSDGLQPGFRLLTDLSGLESMDPECAPHIKTTMDLCNAKGVARVVRIIPDPQKDIGLNIMSLFHYRRRIAIVTCNTKSEAMEALTE